MNKNFVLVALLLGVIVAGCSSPTAPTPTQPGPTVTNQVIGQIAPDTLGAYIPSGARGIAVGVYTTAQVNYRLKLIVGVAATVRVSLTKPISGGTGQTEVLYRQEVAVVRGENVIDLPKSGDPFFLTILNLSDHDLPVNGGQVELVPM